MRSNSAGAIATKPASAYCATTERMCSLTPKISCSTTTAPRGAPAGEARKAENSCPSRAMKVSQRPIRPCRSFSQPGVGLDLDQHLRRDQLADFDHRGRRADLAEDRAVRAPHELPRGNVDDVDARAYNLGERGPGASQGRLDVLERLHGLRVGIALV